MIVLSFLTHNHILQAINKNMVHQQKNSGHFFLCQQKQMPTDPFPYIMP